MIKSTDLRIGNRVICEDFHGKKYETCVGSISDTGIDGRINWAEDIEWEECWTIPLTPKILERFGFHHSAPGYYTDGRFDIESIVKPSVYFNFCLNGMKAASLHYVHQLQNLYFALTGEELVFSVH